MTEELHIVACYEHLKEVSGRDVSGKARRRCRGATKEEAAEDGYIRQVFKMNYRMVPSFSALLMTNFLKG